MPNRKNLLRAIDAAVAAAHATGSPLDVNQLAIKVASAHAPSGLTIGMICDVIRRLQAAHNAGRVVTAWDLYIEHQANSTNHYQNGEGADSRSEDAPPDFGRSTSSPR